MSTMSAGCVEFAVDARHLSKTYPDGTRALSDVSFRVESGTITGYLGPNGAGKTTTVDILTTVIPPSSGDALVCGWSVLSHKNRIRDAIGLATQEVCLDWLVSVQANVEFFGRMFGTSKRVLADETSRLLRLFELDGKRRSTALSLSGGQKRRLQLVIALLKRPTVLFADEPSLGLDPLAKRTLHSALKDLSKSGTTILYSSNDMVDLEKLCSDVVFLAHGEVLGGGAMEDFVRTYGGGAVVTIQCDRDVTENALKTLCNRWDVSLLSSAPLKWREEKGQRSYPQIAAWLAEQGTEIREIRIDEPTLEDAFISLLEGTPP